VERVAERHDRALLALLVVALLLRTALGLVDTVALMQGGVPTIPMPETIAVAPASPFWPATFALLALLGAIGLTSRLTLGWGLGVAACLGYLVSGIADLGSLRPGAPLGDAGFWLFFAANLVVPAAVLVGLLAIRHRFMPRPLAPARLMGRWPRAGRRP
jgi:hypothetical protein